MTIEAQRTALVSMPVPKPTLSQVIIEKIREGATLEETKQYYAFLREIQRDEARIMFDADFVVMQGELPEVPKLGRIDHGGGRGYNYARWEDINDHIKPVLQKYGFGLRFDIITETESLFEIEAILVAGDLRTPFAAVVAADDVERTKPDPMPYLEAARRLRALAPDLEPHECVAIEDSPAGIAARSDSNPSIWISPPRSWTEPGLSIRQRAICGDSIARSRREKSSPPAPRR